MMITPTSKNDSSVAFAEVGEFVTFAISVAVVLLIFVLGVQLCCNNYCHFLHHKSVVGLLAAAQPVLLLFVA
jgi:hypothetical protein